jgi:hypothetical protein
MKNLQKFFFTAALMIAAACLILASCTKEGPAGATGATGPAGPAGANGQDGKDATENCKQCHARAVVDAISTEFEMSKHFWGETAFEEAGNASCGVCHEQKAFVYVCENNTSTIFTFTGGKWVNPYTANMANTFGAISCYTCHTNLHTTYTDTDLALTSKAPVPMTMWGGAGSWGGTPLTIDLTADGGISNLCVKCHQPRPLTATSAYDPAVRPINYDSLKNQPTAMFYDSTAGAVNKNIRPSYRMHVHYGAVGAVYAGKGGIEFPGDAYANSPHTSGASCQDCHMASPMYGVAGGHAFNMRNALEQPLTSSTTWNFAGCNVDGCHASAPLNSGSDKFKGTRATVKTMLESLAAKINAAGGGKDILHADATSANLWAGITAGNYDGYLDIYDASANPLGYWRNPAGPNTEPNISKPKFPKLLNVQVGAMINFQFCLREYSLGIHNTQYVKALLTNSIKALNDAGL